MDLDERLKYWARYAVDVDPDVWKDADVVYAFEDQFPRSSGRVPPYREEGFRMTTNADGSPELLLELVIPEDLDDPMIDWDTWECRSIPGLQSQKEELDDILRDPEEILRNNRTCLCCGYGRYPAPGGGLTEFCSRHQDENPENHRKVHSDIERRRLEDLRQDIMQLLASPDPPDFEVELSYDHNDEYTTVNMKFHYVGVAAVQEE